jgi:CO/xanthine dehydrogenase FAD-binding subunit
MSDVEVDTPATLTEALQMLNKTKYKVIAGGTDVLIRMRAGPVTDKRLLNIYQLDELRYVRSVGDKICIGALTCIADISSSPEVKRFAFPLAQAGDQFGSMQLTNKATIGGNLANASPSGDCIPPLYSLDAWLTLASVDGEREIPVKDFFKGYKQLDLRPNELIKEISFRKMTKDEHGLYLRHALRSGEAISVVGVSMCLKSGESPGKFVAAIIALGAVAPTVVRATKSEEIVTQGALNEARIRAASQAVTASIAPITDVRGSGEYRREMAVNLTYRGLQEILAKRKADHEQD